MKKKGVLSLKKIVCFLVAELPFALLLITSFLARPVGAVAGKDCSNINLSGTVGFLDIGKILEVFVIAIIIIAGIYSFIQLALGGFQYLSSAGDKIQTEHARERITYAILGLVIVAGSYALTQILQGVFGINILGNIQFPGADRIIGNLGTCT